VTRGAETEHAGEWPDSLDALIAAPEHHSLVFENDEVRILDTRIGPGETVPLHTHRWRAALYFLASDHVVQRDADGNVLFDTRITSALVEPGGAVWVGTLPPHTVENVGESEIRFLNLELKRPSPTGRGRP
jgi:quercetin dioxygenase-like cupin family protein